MSEKPTEGSAAYVKTFEIDEGKVTPIKPEHREHWERRGNLLLTLAVVLEKYDIEKPGNRPDKKRIESIVDGVLEKGKHNLMAALKDLGYDIGQA